MLDTARLSFNAVIVILFTDKSSFLLSSAAFTVIPKLLISVSKSSPVEAKVTTA